MNQLEKTPILRVQNQTHQKDEKWQKQLQTISTSLKNLKSTQERNEYIKHIARQRQIDKINHEKQVIQQKSYLLDRSKKKFLSLIRCKDPETFFLKFKPIQKPLNMLRMVSELNLAEKVKETLNKIKQQNESSELTLNNTELEKSKPKILSKISDTNNTKESITDLHKPRKTLDCLINEHHKKQTKQTTGMSEVPKIKQAKQFITRSSSQHSKSYHNYLLKTDIDQLTNQLNLNTTQTSPVGQVSKISSQILARNGIYLQTKNSVHSIKVNSQDDICLEDDNSSLASHTELMLDSLYGNTKKLNKDAKNFTNKKKEYELESIKLFYKKIYCKI